VAHADVCAGAALSPAQIEIIATWVYTEMLRGGYTHVCEFHYLHNDPAGQSYADPAELSRAILRAAQRVGIGITLLPVLYMASGFGGHPPRAEQRRFLSTPERLLDVVRTLRADHAGDPLVAFGIAPHSLRAVPPAALRTVAAGLRGIDARAPVHIHIAEQTGEIEACLAWSGQRPVQWLLEHEDVDARWNLVHATHMTMDETLSAAASGATAVLCPTTEADLGDGVFALPEYTHAQGSYAIGSDSQVCRDWQSELRMLEYSQRLQLQERNVAAAPGGSTGDALFAAALAGGARASGLPLGRIASGARADWVVVRDDKLAFAGRPPGRYLDSLIFDHHAPTSPTSSSPGAPYREAMPTAARAHSRRPAQCADSRNDRSDSAVVRRWVERSDTHRVVRTARTYDYCRIPDANRSVISSSPACHAVQPSDGGSNAQRYAPHSSRLALALTMASQAKDTGMRRAVLPLAAELCGTPGFRRADGRVASARGHIIDALLGGFAVPVHYHRRITTDCHAGNRRSTQGHQAPARIHFSFVGRAKHATCCEAGADCVLAIDARSSGT
jgi:formimidoylglutamate deiminase